MSCVRCGRPNRVKHPGCAVDQKACRYECWIEIGTEGRLLYIHVRGYSPTAKNSSYTKAAATNELVWFDRQGGVRIKRQDPHNLPPPRTQTRELTQTESRSGKTPCALRPTHAPSTLQHRYSMSWGEGGQIDIRLNGGMKQPPNTTETRHGCPQNKTRTRAKRNHARKAFVPPLDQLLATTNTP